MTASRPKSPNSIEPALVERLDRAWRKVRQELLEQRNAQSHWTGHLASSALATATAISALSLYREHSRQPQLTVDRINEMIDKGTRWLLHGQNPDGGWGDTDQSHSNVATSLLVVAALTLAGKNRDPEVHSVIDSASRYIDRKGRIDALRRRYGKDKTFAVPILANAAMADLVPWSEVAALPFEAVLVPQRFYRFVNLPVVSYAIPALVAIGQVKYLNSPPRNPLTRIVRRLSIGRGMSVLEKMQPESGGFLEAIPLTSFVAMSLAYSGRADHAVTQSCVRFINHSFRELGDTGTWPIDTNLATWNSTLAVNALEFDPDPQHLTEELFEWLLGCQYDEVHPFTGAEPGGWGWSDLSGAVPDADDTPGALLALRQWFRPGDSTDDRSQRVLRAAGDGVGWLLDLQNRDGGWPTFCRGWGRLPFDRSGCDITAHVLRAMIAWQKKVKVSEAEPAIERGFRYLIQSQNSDGSWYPLWFGNQDHPDEENPVYGTCKVLAAFRDANRLNDSAAQAGVGWLLDHQNRDGGWGGGPSHQTVRSATEPESSESAAFSSLQETALVVDLLASMADQEIPQRARVQGACRQSVRWMVQAVESSEFNEKWPIGFYFAKLWYYERLYPLIFCVSAVGRLKLRFAGPSGRSNESSDLGGQIGKENPASGNQTNDRSRN